MQKALGMAFASLDDTSRLKFSIKDSVTSGVVVTDVDSEFPGGRKAHPARRSDPGNQPGPGVRARPTSQRRCEALKAAGKKLALLLVSNPQGEVRFVAIAIP